MQTIKQFSHDKIQQLTISDDASLLDAMKIIDQGAAQIALVVSSEGKLTGILTDGDVRRALLCGAGTNDCVAPYVNSDYQSVPESMSRNESLDLMKCYSFRHLPILNSNGELVGLHLLDELIRQDLLPNAAMVLAGGKGTRLGKLTQNIPKPMIQVAGRPILERIVLHLVGGGIRKIFLSVNYLAEQIEEFFGKGEKYGCEIHYLREEQPLGTGGPLALIPKSDLEHSLLVMNGDLVVDFDVNQFVNSHEKSNNAITIAAKTFSQEIPFGCLNVEGGLVKTVVEKPVYRELINAGIYMIQPEIAQSVKPEFIPITQLIGDTLDSHPVGYFEIDEWIDVGLPDQLAEARGN